MIDLRLANKEFTESMKDTLQKALRYAEAIKFKKIDLDFKKKRRWIHKLKI